MTRRERLERKLEKRREWAEKREARSERRFNRAHEELAGLTPGQPILVGHHSERGHRAHLARIDTSMRKGVEHSKMAEHHASKAGGLERQLERSIFSDDEDAIQALEERIAEHEQARKWHNRVNAAWRKAGKPAADDAEAWQAIAEALGVEPAELKVARLNAATCWSKRPFAPYFNQNLGGRIQADKKRIEDIKRRQKRAEAAEEAGGVAIVQNGNYSQVTFAEKPPRGILTALKGAGFHYSGGSWFGGAEVPQAVLDYAEEVE